MSPARKSRTLAITGGTGFVGQALLRLAVASGYELRALTRRWRPPEEGIDWVEGALDRPDSLARLVEGTDAAIHVAGLLTGTRQAFQAVNATGTAAMIDAARRAGVRRFVHVSTLAAREPQLSDYGWSKSRAEMLVAASGLDWTIVRPPAVYGPGDRETLELFKLARLGLMPLPPGGHFSLIHVDDLCRLILAVIDEPDTISEIYEPDDGQTGGWHHKRFARSLAETLGKRTATLAMPRAVLHTLARIDGLVRRGSAKLTVDRVNYMCHPDWVATAERRPPTALWQPQVETADGLRQTADWYRAHGWLR